MIQISEFPRPLNDNGRGLHWSASPYHLKGHELDYWLAELQAMKIKWLKVLDDGGGSSEELCARLVEIGIMPVVRLYIGNPGHIGPRNTQAIRRLLDIGAQYFETNNEPDLALEWPDGKVPKDWLQIVVDNFILDASEIINLGGFPAFPAMGVGTICNPFELIAKRGRQDLFDNGVWVAIHNYTLNHPLDYPYDEVNQLGKVLTLAEYEASRWGWDQDALETINRLRREGANPGDTIREDATCWGGYQLTDELVRAAFGHSVPIMSTEGGCVIGDRQDGRYPRNDAQRHREVTLWIQDFLLTSAPDWYFTVFHWLIANNAMGQSRPGWETQCWYGGWWDKEFGLSGKLPTVDALKATADVVRGGVMADGVIEGRVLDWEGKPVAGREIVAYRDGTPLNPPDAGGGMRSTRTAADGRYRLWGLPGGTYALQIEGTLGEVIQDLTITSHGTWTRILTVPTDLSCIVGRVIDSNGALRAMQTVMLYQGTPFIGSTVTGSDGNYHFMDPVAGEYRLQVTGADPRNVRHDGRKHAMVDFVVPAGQQFELRLIKRVAGPGRAAFFGQILDEVGGPIDGVKIEMSWTGAKPGTVFPTALTGQDAGKARGYFEFVHTRGTFAVRLVDAPWPAEAAEGLIEECVEVVWQLRLREGTA
jgi:hypothetical protein